MRWFHNTMADDVNLDDIGMSTAFQIPETIPDTYRYCTVRVLVLLRASTGVRVGDSPLNMGWWRALPGPAMGVKTAHKSTGAMDSMGIVAFYIPTWSHYGLDGITTTVFYAL